jgi:hypothetical protein
MLRRRQVYTEYLGYISRGEKEERKYINHHQPHAYISRSYNLNLQKKGRKELVTKYLQTKSYRTNEIIHLPTSIMTREMQAINFKQEMLGGFSAGVVGTVIGYPLDLVKTRMQTSSDGKGFLRVGSRIVRKEGVRALYKGMAPPLISLAILNTGNFTSYNYFRTLFGSDRGWDVKNGMAGAMGCWGSSVSTVEHMIKTQMQLDNIGNKRYQGSWHCMTTLMRERGWTVIYTGHVSKFRNIFMDKQHLIKFAIYHKLFTECINGGNYCIIRQKSGNQYLERSCLSWNIFLYLRRHESFSATYNQSKRS